MNMLQATDLVCGYGKIPVIGVLNFSVNANDILIFVGPNGVGKTTLARTLATLLPPLRGKITFNGVDITKHRKDIYYVPEDVDLPLELRVIDYLRLVPYMYMKPVERSEAEKALEIVSLTHAQKARLRELSMGQRRRVMLVTTLLVKAPITIIDDPLNYLDEYASEYIFPEILENLSKMGLHVIITLRQEHRYKTDTSKVIDLTNYSYMYKKRSA